MRFIFASMFEVSTSCRLNVDQQMSALCFIICECFRKLLPPTPLYFSFSTTFIQSKIRENTRLNKVHVWFDVTGSEETQILKWFRTNSIAKKGLWLWGREDMAGKDREQRESQKSSACWDIIFSRYWEPRIYSDWTSGDCGGKPTLFWWLWFSLSPV